MKFLMLSSERYPTNRPILGELFNREMNNLGHELVWLFQSKTPLYSFKKSFWNKSLCFQVPNMGLSKPPSNPFNQLLGFVTKLFFSCMIYIKHKPNRIIVHDGPLEGLVGCFLKNLFGIKFYYILTGPLWEFEKERMVKSKSFNKMLRKIKYIIFNYLYNLTMQKSSLIHPISNQMSQVYFKTEFRKKTHPISECASSKFLNYNSGNKNKKSSSKFIFYIGTISENRDIKFLLNSFLIATKKADDIKLVFLGWGSKAYLEDLNIYINKLGITDKVIFLGKVPYNKVPQFLSKAHIGVSPIPLSKKFLVSTPTKVIDYLSLGITVVANKEIEDQKNIIEESGGGLTTPYNEKSFGNAIATLCNDDYRAHEMGIAGKKWVTKNRSFRLISKDLDTLYSKNIKA